jgi:hypothetical protein
MLLKLGMLVASPFILIALLIGTTGVVVVDVQEGGPGGNHLVIPVPIALAQTAMTFAPSEAKYIDCPEFAPYQELVVRILKELEDAPDFVLAEIDDQDQHVLVKKEKGRLVVEVTEGDQEQVTCNLPIRSALRMVEAYDGAGFPTKAAIWSLKSAPSGLLVHVKDGEDEIKIRRF